MSFLSSVESDASSLGSDIEGAGKSLLTEASKLEHAYLVKCPSGLLGSAMGMASVAAGNLLPGPGGGSLGSDADDLASKVPGGGPASTMVRQYVTFAFNPTSYTISAGARWDEGDVMDKSAGPPKPQFHHTQQRTLTLNELYLDASTGSESNITPDVEFLMSLCSCNGLSSMVESFLGGEMGPPFVKFIWGTSMSFLSYVESMSIEHLMFRANGAPIRAKVSLTLKEMPSSLMAQNPTSGGREAHGSHVIVEGDSLASVAYATLRDPNRWRDLAEENDIDDPLRVAPGKDLLVPSITSGSTSR